ncbi:CopD family protein [Candidatus Uabimicrobium amorphum]|uniref:Uncharacterized protein n=1 Tax=Uabimicrobium amorphum TaxID=2596890 RepID=A0A5S9F6M2_UABAM|nr:CopD family protein [Candidatus Uabimicrobium amorphum]BBM86764.1 hypothetical protein UABAM_05151 [Candidatus Uabimicrobium amorphum]
MHHLYLFLVWWHILGVTIWLGANFFLVLVLLPIAKKDTYRDFYPQLFADIVMRLRAVSWFVLSSVVISGVFLMMFRFGKVIVTWDFWRELYGETLFIKLCFVAAVFIGSFLHDFHWGPKAIALLQQNPEDAQTKKMRRISSYIGRIIFLFGLIVVFLAVKFVRGG